MASLKGRRIADNDPRMPGRVLTIKYDQVDTVYATDGRRSFVIAKRRIHGDGKPRRSGFTLLPESPNA